VLWLRLKYDGWEALAATSGVISGVDPGEDPAWKSKDAEREEAIEIARGKGPCFKRSGAGSFGLFKTRF
jgi:hypothetical protein